MIKAFFSGKAKLLAILLVSSIILVTHVAAGDAPAWITEADSLLSAVSGMPAQIKEAIEFYKTWNLELTSISSRFDILDSTRNKMAECVKETIGALTSDNAKLRQNYSDLVTSSDQMQRLLNAQLDALKIKTDKEIADLNGQIEALKKSLQDAKSAYATLSAIDAEKAGQLISTLSSLRDLYLGAVVERLVFAKELEDIRKKFNSFEAEQIIDTVDLSKLSDCK